MAVLGLVLCYCGLAVLTFSLVWLEDREDGRQRHSGAHGAGYAPEIGS